MTQHSLTYLLTDLAVVGEEEQRLLRLAAHFLQLAELEHLTEVARRLRTVRVRWLPHDHGSTDYPMPPLAAMAMATLRLHYGYTMATLWLHLRLRSACARSFSSRNRRASSVRAMPG